MLLGCGKMMRRLFTFLFMCLDALSRLLSLIVGDGQVEIFRRIATRASLVVGSIVMLTALCFTASTAFFLHRSVAATGQIVNLLTKRDADNGTLEYAPVFSFYAASNAFFVVSSDVYSFPAGFAVGDRVSVRYEHDSPQHARIDSFWQLWFIPFILGTTGFAATIFGIFLGAYDRWLNRRGLAVFAK